MNKNYIGIWLDHKEAYIISFNGSTHKTLQHVHSGIGKKPVPGGGSLYSPIQEQHLLHKWQIQMKEYYETIIKNVHNADHIYLLGPGEAKIELKHRLEQNKHFTDRIYAVENTDKLSEVEIEQKIKQVFFNKQ
ncbi:MAG: hypothetical protein HYW47_07880 [Deltaproteobacteria bacterium]|nr:hypothetical protein [Deltaproteobacteria bacterium]